MAIDAAAIIESSDAGFGILRQAQATNSDLSDSIARLNTETTLRAQSDAVRGSVVDLVI